MNILYYVINVFHYSRMDSHAVSSLTVTENLLLPVTFPLFHNLSCVSLPEYYCLFCEIIKCSKKKNLNNVLPIFCDGIFTLVNPANIKNVTRRVNVLENPFCRSSIRESCISVIGARLWNDLPSVLQKIKSFSHFKIQLKIYLQDLASTN